MSPIQAGATTRMRGTRLTGAVAVDMAPRHARMIGKRS
jgi:hypothetical protein